MARTDGCRVRLSRPASTSLSNGRPDEWSTSIERTTDMTSSAQFAKETRSRSPVASTVTSPVAPYVAIGTILCYQVLLAAEIYVRPDLDVARKPISEYAIGQFGWVMVSAFLLSALSYGSLLAAVRPYLSDRSGNTGAAILLVCTIGTVGVGVFIAEPITTPMTSLSTRGLLHVVFGTTALLLLPFGALRSEEHTSELQSRENLVCRLL